MLWENCVGVVNDLSAGASVIGGIGGSRIEEYASVFGLEETSDDEVK